MLTVVPCLCLFASGRGSNVCLSCRPSHRRLCVSPSDPEVVMDSWLLPVACLLFLVLISFLQILSKTAKIALNLETFTKPCREFGLPSTMPYDILCRRAAAQEEACFLMSSLCANKGRHVLSTHEDGGREWDTGTLLHWDGIMG